MGNTNDRRCDNCGGSEGQFVEFGGGTMASEDCVICRNCISSAIASGGSILTDEDRAAIEWCIFQQATPQRTAVTLRRLLERLK